VAHRQHVVDRRDHALARQEAEREVGVVAGRAHHHRERRPADLDLERLLARDRIALSRRAIASRSARPPRGGSNR
jgi:hypothetical protein